MNKKYVSLIIIIVLISMVLIIGASYAYFKATISGDSETISIKAGKMGLTFDDGTSLVSLPNARPGDYIVKDFNVENKSTVSSTYDYVYKYNIKLVDVNVTFQEEDLEYTLEEYTDDTYEELKSGGVKESGFINAETITEDNEMYIAARITRPPKGEKHYFRLTITFKNLEDVDQNYNQGATFSAKINIDDNKDPIFGSSDLELAIYLDGDELDKLPEDREYYYDSITCENDGEATAKWDYDKMKLKEFEVSVPNTCSLTFSKETSLIDFLKNNGTKGKVTEDDTADKNIRYIGADPNNYIWFNCDDYNFTSSEEAQTKNCEKWRIIGLMNNITIVDEEGNKTPNQSLVKIIRADSVGRMKWDDTGTYGSNNWDRPADLRTSLIDYYNGTVLKDLYNGDTINSKKGITNATKGMIEQVTWNLGGTPNYNNTSRASDFYIAERGNTVPSGASATWDGYIGLMYPSDYGYATGGGSQYNRQTCLDYKLYNWYGTGYVDDCAGNDWLWDSSDDQWTITSQPNLSNVYRISSNGSVDGTYPHFGLSTRPSLYLKSNVQIAGGKGIDEEPYIIGLN